MEHKKDDVYFMELALEQARLASSKGEVPVGAVIVDTNTGEIISSAHNMRENQKSATAHAEVLAIQAACAALGGWRLSGCTLYVTLEPCPMCAGALINSRIDRVVYGAGDMLAGCCGSVINFNSYPFNHAFELTSGICEEECREVLQIFFAKKREK